VEFTDVVSPSTYKSPLILTDPVLVPIPAGSITIAEGPVIIPLLNVKSRIVVTPTTFRF